MDTTQTPRRVLSAGEVELWFSRTDAIEPNQLARYRALLSPEECSRGDRFVFFRDRRDHAVAHALTRWALSHYSSLPPLSWEFRPGAHGKPFVAPGFGGDPSLTFNLSHTHGMVACAVARGGSVGVDVERVPTVRDLRDIASHYFTATEVRMIEGCSSDQSAVRFTELWTLKESFVKGIGLGLTCPLDSFSFSFSETDQVTASGSIDGRWVFLLVAPSAGVRLALARLCEDTTSAPRIVLHDVSPSPGERPTLLRRSAGVVCRVDTSPSMATITGCGHTVG